jgi:hypothetical protein
MKYHTDLTTEHMKHYKKRMGGKWIDSKHARGNGSFPGSCRLAYEGEYRGNWPARFHCFMLRYGTANVYLRLEQ